LSKTRTLGQFIIERQADFPYARGRISRLIRDISVAAKIIHREVNKAGLIDILGEANSTNIQGEQQKKLDIFANEQFLSVLQSGGECCLVATEELEDAHIIDSNISKDAKYAVVFDPFDCSTNIDCYVAVGTIFSI